MVTIHFFILSVQWKYTGDRSIEKAIQPGNLNDEFLNKAGVKRKKKPEENILAPITCARCHYLNGAGISFCWKYGLALIDEAIASVESALSAIEKARGAGIEKDLIEAITKRGIEEMSQGT